jgi:membrane protein DedA with SNARE-associated domain
MPEDIVYYVTSYGYMAIFILVFLQEIGMPNPFPNELLLMFSGYLSFKGLLFFPAVILTALTADFIGTNILYLVFYFAGSQIMKRKPGWFPISDRMIDRLTSKISKGGYLSIFIFRLTPFTRGYTSVITGLLQITPMVFVPIALTSALLWATIYVLAGYLLGPSWNLFIQNIDSFKYLMIAVLVVALLLVILSWYARRRKPFNESSGITNSDTD